MKPTIGKTEAGKDLAIDVQKLLATRMLFDAESGGGKTVALKRLLEQTHGHVQQIIIDPEGEFSTLREKFDYLLCAPEGADAIANPKTAAILARKLRETRVSAVIDIYDLRPQEQRLFVRLFVEELLAAPKNLWNPCLVVIDEAQIFAPEQGEAESLGAIMDLRGRGRKRGLCLILATPRLAQLSKDACAGLQNKLIGVTTLDLDVKRAARDLSMSPTEATTLLRNLEPGEFYCFGPALTRTITKIKVGHIQTKHGQHAVGKDTRPPAPSEKIKDVIAKLTDLPKEAEQEARTLADMKRENINLKRELTLAKKEQPAATAPKRVEVPVLKQGEIKQLRLFLGTIESCSKRFLDGKYTMESALGNVETITKEINEILSKAANNQAGQPTATGPRIVHASPVVIGCGTSLADPQRKFVEAGNGAGITGPQQRILNAIAWFESIGITEPEQTAVAFLAGYTVGGGAWNNPRGALRTMGLIEYRGECLALTDEGRRHASAPEAPLTTNDLHHHVLKRLPGPERKLLTALIHAYPSALPDDSLASATGYSPGGGAFNNPKGRLRSLGLITYPSAKASKAADLLFLGGDHER